MCLPRRQSWMPESVTIMIVTARLTLIPATVALARAEISDRGEFARLLEASVPDNWPPETAADALPLFLSWLEAAPTITSGYETMGRGPVAYLTGAVPAPSGHRAV